MNLTQYVYFEWAKFKHRLSLFTDSVNVVSFFFLIKKEKRERKVAEYKAHSIFHFKELFNKYVTRK